jgi:hypothetical protein
MNNDASKSVFDMTAIRTGFGYTVTVPYRLLFYRRVGNILWRRKRLEALGATKGGAFASKK